MFNSRLAMHYVDVVFSSHIVLFVASYAYGRCGVVVRGVVGKKQNVNHERIKSVKILRKFEA